MIVDSTRKTRIGVSSVWKGIHMDARQSTESIRYATKQERPEIDKQLLEDLRQQRDKKGLVESRLKEEPSEKARTFKLTLRFDKDLVPAK